MKKILMMLLCAASVASVSCNKNNDTSVDDPEDQFDPNGEADWEVRFYTTDSLLLYADYSIQDDLNPSLDCSNTTVRELDTLKTGSKILESYRYYGIPLSQGRVIVLPVHLKVGDHVFRITYTRNETLVTSQMLSHLIHTGDISTDNSKVSCAFNGMKSTYYGDIEDPETNLPELLEDFSDRTLSFTFKMYK